MLWFDNDPKTTPEQKVQRALDYFQRKYGKTPTACVINRVSHSVMSPVADDEKDNHRPPVVLAGLEILGDRHVMPNYYVVTTRPDLWRS